MRGKARTARRRFLSEAGLKARGLDPVALGYLRTWSIASARLDLFGPESHTSKEFWTAVNTTARLQRLLADRLQELGLIAGGKSGPARGARLQAYLQDRNGGTE
jgi:hypothetical protein